MIYKTNLQEEFYTDEKCFIVEILNTFDNKDISIAQARVEPRMTTQLHCLEVEEYYYILEGSGKVEINVGFKKEVSKGDVVRIKSGSSQRITNTSDSDLVFLCICLPRFKPESYTAIQ